MAVDYSVRRPSGSKELTLSLFICAFCFTVVDSLLTSQSTKLHRCAQSESGVNGATIFVVTPTFPRPERFADMTRLTQTLMHINNLIWIVVEDGNQTAEPVERMLNRSGVEFVYLHAIDKQKLPGRGWAQRNYALEHIRKNYANYKRGGVVYFADDDNSYDVRLFDSYIRQVKTIGLWAVGLSGGAKVEAPHVENGKITKWDVIYNSNRTFATDMAGFAVNLKLITSSKAKFNQECTADPENCFLEQFQFAPSRAEPFGWNAEPREVLVWHTKTSGSEALGPSYDYEFEPRTTKRTTMNCVNSTS